MDGPQLLLHPPSPPRQTSPRQSSDMEEQFVLPPVSTLLRETTPSPPTDNYNNSNVLPSLHLPNKRSPSPQIRDSSEATREPVEMFPPLTLTIPCQSISSCSPCTSPASSPFPYQGHLDTPQTSPSSSPHPGHDPQANHHLLLPPPCNGCRTRSPSNASTSSFSSVSSYPFLPSSPALQRRLSDPPLYSAFDHDPPSTSWQRPQSASPSPSLSPATTPLQFKSPQNTANTTCPAAPVVAKRKRGRPPNALRQVSSRENWTFVTPTVWDVKRGRQVTNVHEVEEKEGNNDTPPVTVVVWPEGSSSGEQSRNNGLNTFTSTKMDSTLSMPKKKRGRKPKMQLEGNSCFVWRDLTARRSTNRSNHKRKSSLSTNARTAAAASSRSNNNDNLASRVETLTLAEKSTL